MDSRFSWKGIILFSEWKYWIFLCVIDVFIKYVWVKPLKDKKGKTVLNTFISIVSESNHKPNKLWVDQGREFYNKLIQEWLDNNILRYSTHNEGKSVIAERFIRTTKAKMTATGLKPTTT